MGEERRKGNDAYHPLVDAGDLLVLVKSDGDVVLVLVILSRGGLPISIQLFVGVKTNSE